MTFNDAKELIGKRLIAGQRELREKSQRHAKRADLAIAVNELLRDHHIQTQTVDQRIKFIDDVVESAVNILFAE